MTSSNCAQHYSYGPVTTNFTVALTLRREPPATSCSPSHAASRGNAQEHPMSTSVLPFQAPFMTTGLALFSGEAFRVASMDATAVAWGRK